MDGPRRGTGSPFPRCGGRIEHFILRNQTARYRVVSFDVTLTGLTMRWEQAIVYAVGALMFHRRGGVRFPAVWCGTCCRLDPDGAVAQATARTRAQGAVPRLETARGRPVSDFTFFLFHSDFNVAGLRRARNFSQGRLYQI